MKMKNADRSRRKAKRSVKELNIYSKAFLIGVPAAVMTIISLLLHLVTTSRQWHSIARTVDKWKTLYQLDERQAVTIRNIELEFHGRGSAFSFPSSKNEGEIRDHHRKMSEVILPEFRQKFLADMERGRHRH